MTWMMKFLRRHYLASFCFLAFFLSFVSTLFFGSSASAFNYTTTGNFYFINTRNGNHVVRSIIPPDEIPLSTNSEFNNYFMDFYYQVQGNNSSWSFHENDKFVISGSFLTRFDYNQSQPNAGLSMNCPIITNGGFHQTDCYITMDSDINGNQHYRSYTFVVTGYVSINTSVNQLVFTSNVQSNSGAQTLYLFPSFLTVHTDAGYSDLDYSSVLGSISASNASILAALNEGLTSLESAIQDISTSTASDISVIAEQQQQQYEEMKEKEEQQEQYIEDTQADAQESADNAGEEASDVGNSLISAFITLVTSLHSVHRTNCLLPSFSIYGLNFTNMDLCQFDTPSGIFALGSVGMIFVLVPMGIALVKQLISLYNEIIGGR